MFEKKWLLAVSMCFLIAIMWAGLDASFKYFNEQRAPQSTNYHQPPQYIKELEQLGYFRTNDNQANEVYKLDTNEYSQTISIYADSVILTRSKQLATGRIDLLYGITNAENYYSISYHIVGENEETMSVLCEEQAFYTYERANSLFVDNIDIMEVEVNDFQNEVNKIKQIEFETDKFSDSFFNYENIVNMYYSDPGELPVKKQIKNYKIIEGDVSNGRIVVDNIVFTTINGRLQEINIIDNNTIFNIFKYNLDGKEFNRGLSLMRQNGDVLEKVQVSGSEYSEFSSLNAEINAQINEYYLQVQAADELFTNEMNVNSMF